MVLCHQVRWMAACAVNEDFFPNTNSIVFTVRPNGIGMSSRHRPEFQMTRNMIVSTGRKEQLSLRRHGLQRVDRELSRGNFKTALSIVKQLQEKPGGLCGFGAAKLQVPRSVNTLDELKLIGPDILPLLPLVDPLLELVDRSLKIATLESISFNELESSILDTDSLCEEKHLMCMQHEAGHFLIAYLLGILPRGYAVPSIEAFWKDKFIVGKVEFVGFEFLKEVS
uniref:Uncharacterized protein n=1 Tax=Nelumbo nucifera TaxID=4432 RepID=A0A822YUX2_NELNU|nr:TPA_asm: hypothetical protein HUJ06_008515 [Nelumbo nucifera]